MLFSARCDEELVRTPYFAKEKAGDGRLERSDDSGGHARLDLESHMTHINVLFPPTSIVKLIYCAGP
jgi:hypothetical protein